MSDGDRDRSSDLHRRPFSRRGVIVGLALYVAWMAVLLGGLFWGRAATFRSYGDRAAIADWRAFREEMSRIGAQGPVRRRAPQSHEPPALVLMRDYFGVSLVATLVFGTLLFAMLLGAIRGAFSRDYVPYDDPTSPHGSNNAS
jgi:hypothetical protein